MIWVFLGYAATNDAAFVVGAVVELATHSHPQKVAVAILVFLPCILAMACGSGVFIHGTEEDRQAVRTAFVQGLLRRWQAARAGSIAAGIAIAALVGAFGTSAFGTGSLYFMLILGGLILFLAPVGACAWLIARAKRLVSESRGFPVMKANAGEDEEEKS